MSEEDQVALAIELSRKTHHREQGGSTRTTHGTSGNQPEFEQPHWFHTLDEDADLAQAMAESMQDISRCFLRKMHVTVSPPNVTKLQEPIASKFCRMHSL